MAITRYTGRTLNPWRELDLLGNRLGRLFEEPLRYREVVGGDWWPSVNVEETDSELLLTAELPGLTDEDVDIHVENNVLTLSGDKATEREEKDEGRKYHLWERRSGSFRRSFTLPKTVKPEEITARFERGVLRVVLPKSAEAKSRRIQIGKGK